jgi:dihydrodipicolinate synthase/N-acetylneuraminate lyase
MPLLKGILDRSGRAASFCMRYAAQSMPETEKQMLAKGVFAALLTPRKINTTDADAAAQLEYIDRVLAPGVEGLVLFGSTGEFVHFDMDERTRVLSMAKRRSRVPVLVNVSHSALPGAVELAEAALEIGVAGLLLMPPYFYRYSDGQIQKFFEEFANAINGRTPLYLYNLPFFTNPISPAVATELLASGRWAGIKDSSGDPHMLQVLTELRRSHEFSFFVGNETRYLEGRRVNADGIVSGVAAALPELIVAMDRALRAQNQDRASALDVRLQEFLHWISRFPGSVGIKQAAAARKWMTGDFAVPLDHETRSELIEYQRWFEAWLPTLLDECRG